MNLSIFLGLLCFAVAVVIPLWLLIFYKPTKLNKPNQVKGNRYVSRIRSKQKPLPSVTESRVSVVAKMSRKEYLERVHNVTDNPKSRQKEKIVIPDTFVRPHPRKEKLSNYIPHTVMTMLQGDKKQALRLYEGIANRNQGKSEQWVWDKVESDLERDRR